MPSKGRLHRAVIGILTACFVLSMMPGGVVAAADVSESEELIVMPVIPPDAYEVDNAIGMAKPITVGAAPQEHTIHQVLNDDWMKFTAKKGVTYIAEIGYVGEWAVGPAGSIDSLYGDLPPADVMLELYNGVGQRVTGSGMSLSQGETQLPVDALAGDTVAQPGPRGYSQMATWTAPSNQTGYIRVAHMDYPYEYRGLGQYTVSIRAVIPDISGTVTDEAGNPLSSAYVYAYPVGGDFPEPDNFSVAGPGIEESGGWAWTDANGKYVIADLAAGDYIVHFEAPWYDYRSEYYDDEYWEENADPVTVLGGLIGATGIDAELAESPAQITGRVVDEEGNPIEGITAYVYYWYSWNSAWYNYTSDRTDENGVYEINDIYSYYDYRIVFYDWQNSPERYVQQAWDSGPGSDVYDADTIYLTEELWPEYYVAEGTYDATLTMYPYSLSGTVTDTSGMPLEDVSVVFYSGEDGWYEGEAYTDSNGKWYWISDYEGDVRIRFDDDNSPVIHAGEYYNDVQDWEDAEIVYANPGEPTNGIDAQLDELGPAVFGKVTDQATGAPLKGIQVWTYVDWDGFWWPSDVTETNSKGEYAFDVIPESDVALRFADPKAVYATEYWDSQPRVEDADTIWAWPGDEFEANAALVKQAGRVFGQDRFMTSVSLAKEAHPDWMGVQDVVVASGLDEAAADALSSASLCWAYEGAPLLLTHKDYTPTALRTALAEIAEMNPQVRVHIIGGPNSVPDARLAEMEAIVGEGNVDRAPWGRSRYETSWLIAQEAEMVGADNGMMMPGFLFIANGSDFSKFFDALSASSISAQTGAPIVIVKTNAVPDSAEMALDHFEGFDVHVVGGPKTITNAVYGAVGADDRIYGRDRYATSIALAQRALNEGWLQLNKVALASKIPDALSGGVSIGSQNGPLLTTSATKLPGVTYAFLDQYGQFIDQVVIYGGPNSVSAAVASQISLALKD